MNRGRVFVGMSGGVDSSVAAALLKEQGFEVIGAFIKVWEPTGYKCTWREDRRDAMRVAAVLDIPLVTIDLESEYKQGVVDYMIAEYRAGRTPNPDVMCNKTIKFGAFYDRARQAGAHYIATGHYAQIKNGSELWESADKAKDQSYFLWTITAEIAKHTLLPIGQFEKSEVRQLAQKYQLPTATKKDSQGLCFLGQVDIKEFLKRYIEEKPGKVLNETGEIIGTHEGAFFYTIGERHGFSVAKKSPEEKPLYIVAKDIERNTLTVSSEPKRFAQEHRETKVSLENINWISEEPLEGKSYSARIRYHQIPQTCVIKNNTVIFEEAQSGLASGQSLVLYDGEKCLGGGIICK